MWGKLKKKYCLRMPSTEDLTEEKLIASCLFEETNATTVLIALIVVIYCKSLKHLILSHPLCISAIIPIDESRV